MLRCLLVMMHLNSKSLVLFSYFSLLNMCIETLCYLILLYLKLTLKLYFMSIFCLVKKQTCKLTRLRILEFIFVMYTCLYLPDRSPYQCRIVNLIIQLYLLVHRQQSMSHFVQCVPYKSPFFPFFPYL